MKYLFLSAILLVSACGMPGTYDGYFSSDLYDAPVVHAPTVTSQLNRCSGATEFAATEIKSQGGNRGVKYVVTCD